jgi:hypothetical protein
VFRAFIGTNVVWNNIKTAMNAVKVIDTATVTTTTLIRSRRDRITRRLVPCQQEGAGTTRKRNQEGKNRVPFFGRSLCLVARDGQQDTTVMLMTTTIRICMPISRRLEHWIKARPSSGYRPTRDIPDVLAANRRNRVVVC